MESVTDKQLDLGWSDLFLDRLIDESKKVIKECAGKSEKPLIIQFSGGRDSMCLLGLVQELGIPKDKYVCAYMATGLELKNTIPFVKKVCKDYGVRLLISNPSMHKGNLYKRIEQFQSFPNLGTFEGGGKRLWCCRDLKLRPQKKLLERTYGKGNVFYRLEGIRRFESARRQAIYRDYATTFMRPDDEFKGSWEVYPILNFTDDDVLRYLESRGLPTIGLYKEFGVSGCSFCPFYSPEQYSKILAVYPNQYNRIIEWENKLNLPSVMGSVFLRDIKAAVVQGKPIPEVNKTNLRKPCEIEFEGKMVPTCSIYGHLWVDDECYRCGIKKEIG